MRAWPGSHGRKKAYRWLNHLFPRAQIDQDTDGARLLLDSQNFIDREILMRGGYEARSIKVLIDWCKRTNASAFIDIGANIGIYSVAAARAGIPRVIALEPDVRNRNQLAANLWLNNLDSSVEIWPQAASNHAGSTTFYLARDTSDLSTGLSSIDKPAGRADKTTVPTIRLDDKLDFVGKSVALKIDVEGHEREVLEGAVKLIEKNITLIQIESWEQNHREVEAVLVKLGYRNLGPAVDSSHTFLYSNASFELGVSV